MPKQESLFNYTLCQVSIISDKICCYTKAIHYLFGAKKNFLCTMTSNLLIFGGIAFGYIMFAIICFNYISNIEDDSGRQKAHNAFIAINILLLCGAIGYAYVSFTSI